MAPDLPPAQLGSRPFAIQARFSHHKVGERNSKGIFLRGELVRKWSDAICITPHMSFSDFVKEVRRLLGRDTEGDTSFWPGAREPGQAAGNVSLIWDQNEVIVHHTNWHAVKLRLEEARPTVNAWFYVVPEQALGEGATRANPKNVESLKFNMPPQFVLSPKDLPPPYQADEDARGGRGAGTSVKRFGFNVLGGFGFGLGDGK